MGSNSPLRTVELVRIDDFARTAQEFCVWVGKPGKDSHQALIEVQRHVARLHAAALDLPAVHWPSYEVDDVEDISNSELSKVERRLSKLPLNHYWELFDPLTNKPEDPVCGSLSDDLADIWRDISPPLRLYDSGEKRKAASQWRFAFETHWGEHSTSALRAMHWYFVKSAE